MVDGLLISGTYRLMADETSGVANGHATFRLTSRGNDRDKAFAARHRLYELLICPLKAADPCGTDVISTLT